MTSAEELEEALELAFELDRMALVEPALDDCVEVNVAILGRAQHRLRASEVEQPVRDAEAALSFEDKYLRGGGKGGEAKGGGGAKEGGGSEGMASADRIIPRRSQTPRGGGAGRTPPSAPTTRSACSASCATTSS